MECQKVHVRIVAGMDEVQAEVFGHELPILVQAWGGDPDKIRFVEHLPPEHVDDPAAEYERMRRLYRFAESGEPFVDLAYSGGALTFHEAMAHGHVSIEGIAARERRRTGRDAAGAGATVQPKPNEDGYLNKPELAAMLSTLRGETVNPKSFRRTRLRADLMMELEEELIERGEPAPTLDTDPQLAEAYAKIEALRAAEGGDGDGE